MRRHFGGTFRILLARDSHPLCNVLKIKRSSRKHFLIHFPPRHAKYTHSHTQYTAVHTHTDSAHTRTHARPLNSCSCTWAPPFSLPLCPLPDARCPRRCQWLCPGAVLCGYRCGCGWVFAFFKLCEFILFCFYFYGAWNYAYFAIFCLALKEIKKKKKPKPKAKAKAKATTATGTGRVCALCLGAVP